MRIASGATAVPRRALEPTDRIAEVLFGLIMVLTFTGSLSIAESGRDDVRAMLIGALGCNLAWGLIDGVLYLMACASERGSERRTLRALREARDPGEARRIVGDALPAALASAFEPEELERAGWRLRSLPEPAGRVRLSAADWRAAAAVFLLVTLSTLPVSLPFVFVRDLALAMRLSNAVAIAMLFGLGAAYGRLLGGSPWRVGVAMVALGCVLVAITIALGG
jgi:hypothetical protein